MQLKTIMLFVTISLSSEVASTVETPAPRPDYHTKFDQHVKQLLALSRENTKPKLPLKLKNKRVKN